MTRRKSAFLVRALSAVLIMSPLLAAAQFPPECAGLKEGDRPEIERQRAVLAREVENDLAGVDPVKVPQAVRDKQVRLLELVFKLDCIRPEVKIDPLHTTRAAADAPRNILVPVFFATNRTKSATEQSRLTFTADVANQVTWGKTVVSVPTMRNPGELNLPTLWKWEFSPDLDKHFVLTQVTSLGDKNSFSAAVKEDLAKASTKSLLLFIHGYRVTFDEAAMRTAQLAHDLNFRGVPMFYSWPSKGELKGYWHDEEAVQLSEGGYNELLDTLSTLPFTSIYVLAHSMGNRLVTTVHNERIRTGQNLSAIKEVLLAAPDINANIFNQKIAPAFAEVGQPRTTIYISSNDVALTASKVIHSFHRLGDANPPVYRRAPFETVDASGGAPLRRAAGHSYVFDSPKVITDIQRLLVQGQSADQRPTLQRIPGETPVYWKFK